MADTGTRKPRFLVFSSRTKLVGRTWAFWTRCHGRLVYERSVSVAYGETARTTAIARVFLKSTSNGYQALADVVQVNLRMGTSCIAAMLHSEKRMPKPGHSGICASFSDVHKPCWCGTVMSQKRHTGALSLAAINGPKVQT
jgi:hypothetical protein